jgi:hypothetical protein
VKLTRVICLTVLVGLVATFGACGNREQQAAAPTPKAVPAPAAPAVAPPAPTLQALRLTPDAATLAVAFPSSGEMLDQWLALAKRFHPQPEELQALVDEALRIGAEELETPKAKSFPELLRAQGIDPQGPAGLYVDTTSMSEAYRRAYKSLGEERKQAWQPLSEPAPPPQHIDIDASPAIVGAFRCADAAQAERAARSFLARKASTFTEKGGEAGGVTLHLLSAGNMGYLVRGGWLIMGNSESLLRSVADRVEHPATVRYGSPELPARPTDQAVALVRADLLARLARDVLPVVAQARPGTAPWIELQYPLLEQSASAYSSDPAVVTLERDGDKVELLSRLDYARHPKLEKMFGEPAPLRLAGLSPAASVGMLALRITDETKNTLEKAWFAGAQQNGTPNAQVQMSMGVMRLLMSLTRNNLAIAVTGVKEGWPLGVVVVEMESPESTKAWLTTMGMSLEPTETYRDTEIMQVPLPLPVQVHYGFAGNLLVLSDDLPSLHSTLDQAQSGAVSPFFTSLEPPFDPAQPGFNALVLTDRFFTDVLGPLVGTNVQDDSDPVLQTIRNAAENLRQIRAARSVQNGWREGRVTVYLKPQPKA